MTGASQRCATRTATAPDRHAGTAVGQDGSRGQAPTRVDQDQPASTPERARPHPLAGPDRRTRAVSRHLRLRRRRLADGTTLPLCRLRYGGSASRWGFAIYLASRDGYQDSVLPNGLPAGSPEEALDCACGLYLNDPTAWTQPPTN
jgi:hypothetical protein